MDAFGSVDLFSAFDGPKYLPSCPPPDNLNEMQSEEQEVEASEDIEALKAENTLLRSRLRIYDKLSHLIASDTPIAEIDYFKSELSIESQYRIESELYTLMSESRELQEEHAPDGTEGPHGHVLYLPNYMIDSSGRFFNVIPSEFGDNKPLYPQIYTVALDDCDDKLDMFGSKLPDQGLVSSGPGCFNCGGPHIISECKLPRDQKKIAEARKEFQQTRGSSNRYHVKSDAEIDEKYKGFLPGVMSDSLRLALGLEDSELPSHVYRMRNFGYPPGYSIDPPKENSKGLVLYETPTIIRGEEDGEVSDAPAPTVIPFPGYTAPLEDGVIDKYRIRNNPYNAVTPSLNDKRKPKVRPTKRRRVEAPVAAEDDDSMEVDNIGGEDVVPATAVPSYLRPTMAPLSDGTPPLPSDTPPSSPHPPPPCPTDTPPSQRAAPPLPKGAPPSPLPKLDLDQEVEEGECDEAAQATSEEAATEEVTVEVSTAEEATAAEATEEVTVAEPEATEEAEEDTACNGANMSIVSETNKIGIKFDTVEDYGPLDQRAGNFTRLQSILRSRKKSTTKDK